MSEQRSSNQRDSLLQRLRGDNCHCRMATEAADEIERLTVELDVVLSKYTGLENVEARLRAELERAGQRLTSLAKQTRCRCQSTAGCTHHCEACRALKHAEDIAVMLRGDIPARATVETTAEQL